MDFLNSDFLKLATILLAIIAIVALFLQHKPQGQSTRTIHIWYICGVATFVLIELITWICVGNPDASQIMLTVSFAATLASLILSVLAIFITVISNDSLTRVKDRLEDVPTRVSEAVNHSLTDLQKLSATIEQSATNSKNEQEQTVRQISDLLDQLEGHIDEHFRHHEEKIDNFSHKIDQSIFSSSKSMQNELPKFKEDLMDFFINNTSFLSKQMTYVASEYVKKDSSKPLSINEVLKILGYTEDNDLSLYMFCVLMMLNSFGLVTFQQVNNSNFNDVIIQFVNPDLAIKCKSKLRDEMSENLFERINNYISTLVVDDFEDEQELNKHETENQENI